MVSVSCARRISAAIPPLTFKKAHSYHLCCAPRRGHGQAHGKEGQAMQTPIIPIERASEKTVMALIESGILYVDAEGIHVTEKTGPRHESVRPKTNKFVCLL